MTVPFFHTSTSSSKADNSLSKADCVPWIARIGAHVIIMKLGNVYEGYVGTVKDVLRGQDTASGLKLSIQLQHLDPSAPFKSIIVDHNDVVKKGSVNDL